MNKKTYGAPVYVVVEDTIRNSIFSGAYNPGDLLPSENELCTQFAASRETVRKSLKNLENDGFIVSRPGKGYFVSVPEHNRFTVTLPDVDDGYQSKLKSISVVSPDPTVRRALLLPFGARAVLIHRQILSLSGVVALETNYLPYEKGQPIIESSINYAVFPEIAAAKTTPFAFCTRMEITAESATPELAELLECEPGEPLLVVIRYLIGQNGQRIGYGRKYLKQPYGKISGQSGYLPDEQIKGF